MANGTEIILSKLISDSSSSQMNSIGAVDMVNFCPRSTVPPRFEGRKFYQHNPNVTLMRTTPEENAEIGRRLGWTVYDRDLVDRIAQEMGLRAGLLQSLDERHTSWMSEAMQQFLATTATPYVGESNYVRHLAETILALGTHGECVIVGRGSAMILPEETTLRVRLMAPFRTGSRAPRQC